MNITSIKTWDKSSAYYNISNAWTRNYTTHNNSKQWRKSETQFCIYLSYTCVLLERIYKNLGEFISRVHMRLCLL